VDDAHAFGVIGETGKGSLEYHGVGHAAAAACGTLSKAFGGGGGFVPGDRALRAAIEEYSRIPLGASAPSIPIAAASAAGVRILREHPEMRARLWDNARLARDRLRSLGFDLEASPVPIVSLTGSPGVDLRRVHAALRADDIAVLYVPPRGYSDAPDVESLRIAIFSTHSPDQIARLADAVRRAL
jgi:7-keto-8-aminopelargonate synthetase-like enzyme